MLQARELFDQPPHLRFRPDGEPEVAAQVRVVAPVAHQNAFLAQPPGDFRRMLADARQDKIRVARDVGDPARLKPARELVAAAADFRHVPPDSRGVADCLNCRGQRERIHREGILRATQIVRELNAGEETPHPQRGETEGF